MADPASMNAIAPIDIPDNIITNIDIIARKMTANSFSPVRTVQPASG
jgi:hypothetical protein